MLSQSMHSDPPVYHRDIRQPNIMKRIDGKGWFLIDFSDASMTPTTGVSHLTEHEHSTFIRQDGHGPEVDIWGIGNYLDKMASFKTCGMAKPKSVSQMAHRWMDDITMTATTALEEIEVGIYHINMRVMY